MRGVLWLEHLGTRVYATNSTAELQRGAPSKVRWVQTWGEQP